MDDGVGRLRSPRGCPGPGVLAYTLYATLRFRSFLACVQLPFDVALKHKLIVCEIAENAHSQYRKPLLGVLYDELARCTVSCFFSTGGAHFIPRWQEAMGGQGRQVGCFVRHPAGGLHDVRRHLAAGEGLA